MADIPTPPQWIVHYDDRSVTTPPQRPLDIVRAHRDYGDRWPTLAGQPEGLMYQIWLTLGRHDDPAEHPTGFEEWLPSVADVAPVRPKQDTDDAVPLPTDPATGA